MALKRRVEDLKASFERLSTRERRMVGALGGSVVLLLGLGIAYWIWSSLDEMRAENLAIRQAVRDLEKHKDRYLQRERQMAALRAAIPETALELNSYVEKAASGAGVKIDESSAATETPVGARYTQRGLEIKLRKITVAQLAKLLKRLEGSSTHLVRITELSIHTRWNKHDELDVELVVSTYERSKGKKKGRGRRG